MSVFFPNEPGHQPPFRVLLLGGTSEIGLAIIAALEMPEGAEVILAGRDEQRLAAAGKELPYQVRTTGYDAVDTGSHQAFADAIFAGGPVDMVISAAGILVPQEDAERDVRLAATMIETNFTGHATTLLAIAARLRAQGRGTIVVLSSIAAVRPRKANFVYGAAKAALDAFARGLADSLHGTGVRVLLVRPGFVTGRMTAGMPSAPLATTPARVGAATAAALRRHKAAVWIPAPLAGLALALRLVPRSAWRRIERLPRGQSPRPSCSWGSHLGMATSDKPDEPGASWRLSADRGPKPTEYRGQMSTILRGPSRPVR